MNSENALPDSPVDSEEESLESNVKSESTTDEEISSGDPGNDDLTDIGVVQISTEDIAIESNSVVSTDDVKIEVSEESKDERKIPLNRHADEQVMSAVPSIKPTTAPLAMKLKKTSTDEEDAISETIQPVPTTIPDPVAIPSGNDLNAEMEAEIEAALSSGELTATPVPVSMPLDDEESEVVPITEDSLEEEMHLTGKIQSIHGDDVFLDLGLRSPGIVSLRQFASGKKPTIGVAIEVVVAKFDREEGLIHLNLPRGLRKVTGNWDGIAKGQIVDCSVVKTNKGGLEVNVGNVRGFIPASQVDLGFVSDLETYVGQQFRAQVTESNPKKKNLVLSRRTLLIEERKENEAETWKQLVVGQVKNGKVKTIKNYGCFIDIGGVDGFLHIGEMSWNHIRNPAEVVKEGQQVDVQILKLDPDSKKISLGMKQLSENPWSTVAINYPVDSTISGKVTKTTEFGAFVELEPMIEGLIHISELDHSRVKRVTDVLEVGQNVSVKVLDVSPEKRRISLSMKSLKEKPVDAIADGRSQEDPEKARKRQENLKGGMGAGAGGMLFGNPTDFNK